MHSQRKRLAEELVEIARGMNDPWLSYSAAAWQLIVGQEAGDGAQVDSALATMSELAASVGQPSLVWVLRLWDCASALTHGDLEAAENFAARAFEVGNASGEPDAALFFGSQLFNIRVLQGARR